MQTLREAMMRRELPVILDYLSPRQSVLLDRALRSFGQEHSRATPAAVLASPGHHLIHFPAASQLLPDGTDPSLSPGKPWTNRMWAGGKIQWAKDIAQARFPPDGAATCEERIQDVVVKGADDSEKVFVTLERRIGPRDHVKIIEDRNLVFMSDAVLKSVAGRERKNIRPGQTPDISHELLVDDNLLFQFSALTYNAHKIHLDRSYAVGVEGHKGLLIHGPLSLLLMCTLLSDSVDTRIAELEYRNIAPLYSGETIRVCGTRNATEQAGEGERWDVWVENPEGGVAVKGRARFHGDFEFS